MKKIFYFAALALSVIAFSSCTDKQANGNNSGSDSTATEQEGEAKMGPMGTFTIPEGSALKDADNISYILFPSSYASAMEKGEDINGKTAIYYNRELAEAGETNSKLSGNEVRYPNNLLIPIYKDAKAKKGDVVLTWWQSGSGMQRAIVIDASTATEPVAVYLDRYWKDDPDHKDNQELAKGEKLKPNSFNVLKDGEWQAGAAVAYRDGGEWKKGTLMHVDGNKVLLSVFSSHLFATTKDRCKLIPFKEKIKKGDKVWATFVDGFRDGYTVKEINEKVGRVWVQRNGSSSMDCKSIVEVTKVLD